MFMGIRPYWLLPIFLALTLSSCGEFDEPEPLNPQRFYGCYGNSENQLTIAADVVHIDGTNLPYEIQERKVGIVIALPAIFVSRNGALQAEDAAEHFYRLIDDDSGRSIIIADQSAYVHELQLGGCT